jgi:hypothetical protein
MRILLTSKSSIYPDVTAESRLFSRIVLYGAYGAKTVSIIIFPHIWKNYVKYVEQGGISLAFDDICPYNIAYIKEHAAMSV